MFSPGKAYVNVSNWDLIQLDIRYATTNNFVGKNLYGDFRSCYLHQVAAEKFKSAVAGLKKMKPGYRFLVFDCLRPRRIQRILWAAVAGTPQQPYVANPDRGSVHNFGFAIDLSLVDEKGRELDMGTPFDSFLPLAEPRKEAGYLKSGELTMQQLKNRQLLRTVMEQAGFHQLPNEWWHFDALSARYVRAHYAILE